MTTKSMTNCIGTVPTLAHVSRACMGAALFAIAVTAGAQGMPMAGKPAASGMAMPSTGMKESMAGMMQGMQQMPSSGDTDQDFAAMMKMHHQGAIEMAKVELASGKDPVLRKMAKEIIAAQKKEIEEFDAWMKKHPGAPGMDAHK